jgi:serine/threonine protein kinase/Flp pilus assembly protein TadD
MIGRKLSHYEILEALGAGGMGEVYRARDTSLGRDVAIKVLPPDRSASRNARQRFQREAMAASALNHPNIITIHEINSEGDIDFIVMEYVRGSTLAALLQRARMPLPQIIRYCIQIADAVGKAHGAGIVHRDLKPGNVMITHDGLVKVLDFGLAKFVEDAGEPNEEPSDTDLTMPGTTTGTLAYMSPEQARGDKVDSRSDIFSFGIIVFQWLSGKLPFGGQNTMAMMHNLHFNPPRNLGEACPGTPPALTSLTARMLEKNPALRIQTMLEVGNELRAIARTEQWSQSQDAERAPTVASRPRPAPPPSSGSWKWIWIAGVLVSGVLLLAIVGLKYFPKRAAVTPAPAQEPQVADNAFDLYKQARNDLDHYDRPKMLQHAIKLLERAVQLDPSSAASYAALAEAYDRKNGENPDPQWMKLASQYAHRAVELNGDLAVGHISLGMVETQQGHSEEAEEEFKKAVELDPKNEVPHAWLGVLYDKTDRRDLAGVELQRAIELDPKDWQNYMELGLNAYLDADYPRAAEAWEQALKLEPDNVLALRNLGGVYHMLDRDDDAATALQRALEIEPDADTYNNLGTLRFYQGRYQDAVPAFEKTVALAANNYDNWASLGDAYRWTPGNQQKAQQAYEQAIQLAQEEMVKAPKDMSLRASIASYMAKAGEKKKALEELKPVEQAQKKDAATWYRQALVYEICGRRQQALNALAIAVKAGQSLKDIKNEPELTALRADPEYHLRILESANTGKNR